MQQKKEKYWIRVKSLRKYLWVNEIGGKRMKRLRMMNRGQHRLTGFMITKKLFRNLLTRTRR